MNFRSKILNLFDSYNVTDASFETLAMEIFHYQSVENPVYKKYLDLLRISPAKISELKDVPFMPISFYKSKIVKSGNFNQEREVSIISRI